MVGGINAAELPIAVPPLAGDAALGRQLAETIASGLRFSGRFEPTGPAGLPQPTRPQVTAPAFDTWRGRGAAALVQGYVEGAGDQLTVGCYLYDVASGRELNRAGFTVARADWRRAGRKCADMAYGRLTGEGAFLDTRLAYVAETGPKNARVKRLAVMDADGSNHRFLTDGKRTVLTPVFSPKEPVVAYMSYEGERPRVWVHNLSTGQERLLVPGRAMTFAPRFSPDGRNILFSMAANGNTDLFRVPVAGGTPTRLTSTPGIDTGGSYSPDGQRIVFESDRGGSQQLYVMNADGSNPRRISFGGGSYATPAWSPKGTHIAFTRIGGGAFRIGVMSPTGSGEKLLTDDWQDEAPSWAPNGRFVMFFRTPRGAGGH